MAIYSLPRLLNEIRDTHRAERSHVDLLDRLTAVDLLHIDDVGAERTTDWVLEELYSIVNARYEDERSIVITTNILDREALCEQITERTVSRLTEMCDELPLIGHDHRMEQRTRLGALSASSGVTPARPGIRSALTRRARRACAQVASLVGAALVLRAFRPGRSTSRQIGAPRPRACSCACLQLARDRPRRMAQGTPVGAARTSPVRRG